MREVVPHLLWIGSAADARDWRRRLERGVAAVVDVAIEEPAAQLPHELIYCRFPLVDGRDNSPLRLAAAIRTVVMLLGQQVPTLVACGAGMSRAPAIVAIALALVLESTPDAALNDLARHAPHDVSVTLWRDLLAAYESIRVGG